MFIVLNVQNVSLGFEGMRGHFKELWLKALCTRQVLIITSKGKGDDYLQGLGQNYSFRQVFHSPNQWTSTEKEKIMPEQGIQSRSFSKIVELDLPCCQKPDSSSDG
jgi:hypothetical protein